MFSGMKQSNNKVEVQRPIPIKYHLCRLSDKSVIGAQRKRQMFADSPNAVIDAAAATENPCCVNRNGSVIETKPPLTP
jgi:hypothetical protein